MTVNALAFNGINFDIIDRFGLPWLRSPQIAEALGYADASSINRIYARNTDEFTDQMTGSVKMTDPNGAMQETRIFSLRGAHLLAMLARTPIAKEFRRWVLDVLDREKMFPAHPHKPIQDEAWRIAGGNTNIKAELCRRAKQYFGVARITEIPAEQCQAAVEYIRSLEGDYIGKPVIVTAADPTRVAHAFALASEVASVASRTVFEAVMNRDVSLMCNRWVFSMNTNAQGQSAFYAGLLERDAFIATYSQLAERIAAGDGMLPSNKELAELASACNRKLAQRLEHSARR